MRQELTGDQVERYVEAPPDVLYDLVADVTRTPEISPDVVRCEWLDGATGPAVGAKFKGSNKRGFIRSSTTNTVEEAEVDRAFSFVTKDSATRWTYRLEPDGEGTRLTESRAPAGDYPALARFFTRFLLGGVEGHTEELRDGMRRTLERVKAIAEGG